MKTKLFMTALALPLAFVACTNEDVLTSSPANQGETLTVTVGRGGFGADTRAAWVPNGKTASFEWTSTTDDKIGMALLNPADASKVVTNYEMSLIGWYNANGKGADTDYSETAQNGVKYTNTYVTAEADGNAGAGVFQATGLTVMDGDYVVYHPYDENFAKAGYMDVDFRTNQVAAEGTTKKMLEAAGENTFSYSLPKHIEKGGKVAADFATKNLSALVKLQLEGFENKNLKKIILLEDAANFNAQSSGFLKTASLNAEKIKTMEGADVLEKPTYTSMVTLSFENDDLFALSGDGKGTAYMVAGPRTSTNSYTILLIDRLDKASVWKSDVKLESGKIATIDIKNDGKHPFSTTIITDGKSLSSLLWNEGAEKDYEGKKVYVLGDIKVDWASTADINADDLTILPYAENPETAINVTVTENCTVTTGSKGVNFEGVKVTFNNEEGEDNTVTLDDGCALTAENVETNVNVDVNSSSASIKDFVNNADLTVGAGKVFTTTGKVENNGVIEIAAATTGSSAVEGGTWNIGSTQNTEAEVVNAGEINNYFTINNFGSIDNADGTYVQKLEGKFIGQNDIPEDKQGNYIIEVNNSDQFIYANTRNCSTIRVIGGTSAKVTIGDATNNVLKGLAIEKKVELTALSAMVLDGTKLNGGLYIINDNTQAEISGTAHAETIQINAASEKGKTAPKLTILAESIITANSIVNNGTGSIQEGGSGIPADVKTLSSTGSGDWDNWPQVVKAF